MDNFSRFLFNPIEEETQTWWNIIIKLLAKCGSFKQSDTLTRIPDDETRIASNSAWRVFK